MANQSFASIMACLLAAATASVATAQVAHVPSYLFNGDSAGDQLGFSVSGAGDVNNDGFDDLIVGVPNDDNRGDRSGSARVFFNVPFTSPTPPAPCPGDADGNRVVNFADITEVPTNLNFVCP